MKNVYRIWAVLLIGMGWGNAQGQTTIWSENFDSYVDGTTTGGDNNTGTAGGDWAATGCTTCSASSTDWWEVRSGVMEARDVNDEYATWTSEVIDISGFSTVSFSVDVSEQGDHEGLYLNADDCTDQSNEDFADVEYRIDGGAWVLISNYLGWCGLYASCGTHTLYGDDGGDGDCRATDDDWGNVTVTQTGLSGSTLELRFTARNSAGSEYIGFDNV